MNELKFLSAVSRRAWCISYGTAGLHELGVGDKPVVVHACVTASRATDVSDHSLPNLPILQVTASRTTAFPHHGPTSQLYRSASLRHAYGRASPRPAKPPSSQSALCHALRTHLPNVPIILQAGASLRHTPRTRLATACQNSLFHMPERHCVTSHGRTCLTSLFSRSERGAGADGEPGLLAARPTQGQRRGDGAGRTLLPAQLRSESNTSIRIEHITIEHLHQNRTHHNRTPPLELNTSQSNTTASAAQDKVEHRRQNRTHHN